MNSYYIITLFDGTQEVLRDISIDGGQFPMDEGNPDYREYLAWLANGNTPEEWNSDAN